jgi:hypothetical protein
MNVAPQALASPTLGQFNSATGVLLGTTIQLSSTRTQTISGTLENGIPSSPSAKTKTGDPAPTGTTTTGTGSSDAQLLAPGVSNTFDTISATATVGVRSSSSTSKAGTGTGTTSTFSFPNAVPTDATVAVGSGDLNSYVGGGTVTVNLTAPTLFQVESTWTNGISATGTVTKSGDVIDITGGTSSTANYGLVWDGGVVANYEYLQHADVSFNGIPTGTGAKSPDKKTALTPTTQLVLNLDFGQLYRGDPFGSLDFSIFNAAGDRVGLDLDTFFGSGDVTKLTTNLTNFANLGAGSNLGFKAFLDTSDLGAFSAGYSLNLSDADVGATSTRFSDYSLTLNLMGTVIDRLPGNTVPEPNTVALLGLGLLGMMFSRGRRRL